MAKINSPKTAGKAIVLSNIQKMLDGKNLCFAGIFNGAKRNGLVDVKTLASEFGLNAKEVNNWSRTGNEPSLKTQIRVLEYILENNT